MSLTAHLRSKRSPVRAWFEEHLPATRTLARDANHDLCADSPKCPLPRPEGADPGLVGTAIDYLLRACLRVSALDDTVATHAADRLDPLPRIAGRAGQAEREAVRRIKALRPSQRKLNKAQWRELCQLCLLLGRFEQYFRTSGMNMALIDLLVQPLFDWDGKELDQLIAAVEIEPSLQDLEVLGRAVLEDQRRLRRAGPLRPNPKFALSNELGGADADLIAGSTLLDFKATTTRSIVGREALWQLLGYVFADSDDQYGIDTVGICALRWRTTITWQLDELLPILSGGYGAPLSVLRTGFAEVVQASFAEEMARREARRREKQTAQLRR